MNMTVPIRGPAAGGPRILQAPSSRPSSRESELRFRLDTDLLVNDTAIPAGRYQVFVDEPSEQIVLQGEGRLLALRAFLRRAKEAGPACIASALDDARVFRNGTSVPRGTLRVRPGDGREWIA